MSMRSSGASAACSSSFREVGAEAHALFALFQDAVTGKVEPDDEALGKLVALTGVKEFPSRVKCAMLAWHALLAAMDGAAATVSTE